MSPYTKDSSQKKDNERPILPPIRDLFRDLRPHDSPASTLARLRVSDDLEGIATHSHTSAGPSSRGTFVNYREPIEPPTGHRTPHSRSQYQHHDPSTSSRESSGNDRGSLHLHKPYNVSPYDSHRENEHHSSSHGIHGLPAYTSYQWPPQRQLHQHSNATPSYYDSRMPQSDNRSLVPPYPPALKSHGHNQVIGRPWTKEISTAVASGTDDGSTPAANYGVHGLPYPPSFSQNVLDDGNIGSAPSKYECNFCGKGFNRPSSLKIHLNSHTGEKPFVCPVETCGRSFSVLSNMRRHARVHTQISQQQLDPSSDEDIEQSLPLTTPQMASNSTRGSTPTHSQSSTSFHHRRESTASSSSASLRSHIYAPDGDTTKNDIRPEKRTRRHPK